MSDCASSGEMEESRSVRGLGGREPLSSVLWNRMPRRRDEGCGDVCGVRKRVVAGAGHARVRKPPCARRACCEARVRERRAVEVFIVVNLDANDQMKSKSGRLETGM